MRSRLDAGTAMCRRHESSRVDDVVEWSCGADGMSRHTGGFGEVTTRTRSGVERTHAEPQGSPCGGASGYLLGLSAR